MKVFYLENLELCGRKQRVEVRGSYSKWIDVIGIVPQGSTLEPALFIMYVRK